MTLLKIMAEINKGLFNAAATIYTNNRGSILRTIVYTIGHFVIAITVLMLIADVSLAVALTDAIVEPLANSVWYFLLDKFWASKIKK
jgi:uncharacterized membrane protein|tara:strand:- start:330 stop:590 length:261 start_codon:yes stop_codon:yes gene_type:complete